MLEYGVDQVWEKFFNFIPADDVDNLDPFLFRMDQSGFAQDFVMERDSGRR